LSIIVDRKGTPNTYLIEPLKATRQPTVGPINSIWTIVGPAVLTILMTVENLLRY